MSTANDKQIGGDHYKTRPIQPWDYAAANDLDFFQGSVVKYVTRYKEKGGLKDLEKAQHYLEKMIELWTRTGHPKKDVPPLTVIPTAYTEREGGLWQHWTKGAVSREDLEQRSETSVNINDRKVFALCFGDPTDANRKVWDCQNGWR